MSRDNATGAIRVASSGRRGFACRLVYSANCFLRKRFFRCEREARSAHCRDEPCQMTYREQESRHEESMPSADHLGRMIRKPCRNAALRSAEGAIQRIINADGIIADHKGELIVSEESARCNEVIPDAECIVRVPVVRQSAPAPAGVSDLERPGGSDHLFAAFGAGRRRIDAEPQARRRTTWHGCCAL